MADQQTAVDPKIEASARTMGWVPQEQFRGDAAKWVDAETFVKRGEEVMPLLKANNKRLEQELSQLRGVLGETQEAVKAGQEAIAALKETQTEFTRAAVVKAKGEIRTALRAAREANDMDAIETLEDQLDEIRDSERDVKAKKAAPAATPAASPAAPKIDPDFVAFQKENPWFGNMKDKDDARRTAYTMAEAQALRADPANAALAGRAFYDLAAKNADELLNPHTGHSKVETGNGSASASGSPKSGGGKKTYRDLPSDAKAVCDRQANRLVGPGRAFKTVADWQQNYADQYFTE